MLARYFSSVLGTRTTVVRNPNGTLLSTLRQMVSDKPPDPDQRPKPQGLKLGTLVLSPRDVMVIAVGLAATVWLYDLVFEEGWLKKPYKEGKTDQFQPSSSDQGAKFKAD